MRIKELREEKGLSQSEVAKAIGGTQSNLAKWEKGSVQPGAEFIKKLADFFNVSADYLLGRTDDLGAAMPVSQKLPDDESELLRLYRLLPPEFKRSLLNSAKLWAGEPASASDKKKA